MNSSLDNIRNRLFRRIQSIPIINYNYRRLCGSDIMGDCELCGAMKVGVKHVKTGKTEVSACSRCVEKLNLGPKTLAPGLTRAFSSAPRTGIASTGAGITHPRGKNIMTRSEKDLADNFSLRISTARKQKNWNQAQLGKRMAETVNIVKSAESGKRPTDSVIRKFERILGISLMVEHKSIDTRALDNGPSRGITLGDYFIKEE
jgi:ribosome-binding protein aMBF1 (putative translation factor)